MTSSAPAFRALWAFSSVEQVPMTLAPNLLAICTISSPVPPAQAWTSAVCVGPTGNVDRTR